MKTTPFTLLIVGLLASAGARADIFDLFKPKPAPAGTTTAAASLAGLSQDQMVGGLKEALSKGVQQAVSNLGKPDGFLADLKVRIPMPDNLQKVEKTLRMLRQDQLAEEFVATMNRAAEQAVPQAAAVLGDSVKQMSIADAKSVLTGGNTAATDYFRRTSEDTLRERLLPIVKSATEKAGVTNSYKQMSTRATKALGPLGGAMLGAQMPDLDTYIANKALDGLFLKIAEQETLIRQNPVARTSELLKAVFGAK